jgi:hypothetical protein
VFSGGKRDTMKPLEEVGITRGITNTTAGCIWATIIV